MKWTGGIGTVSVVDKPRGWVTLGPCGVALVVYVATAADLSSALLTPHTDAHTHTPRDTTPYTLPDMALGK